MKRFAWGCALVLCFRLAATAQSSNLDERVRNLAQQLRCLVCQNETLADSRADLAADLRQQIHEQMAAGRSDQEIITFLSDRYGDFVLYRPPLKPRTYLLWFGPFFFLAAGFVWLYRFLGQRQILIERREVSSKQLKLARELLDGTAKEHS